MTGLHCIVVVVPVDVHECKVTGVNPSSPLNHQLFMAFHGISISYCVRNVSENILTILLTVNSH